MFNLALVREPTKLEFLILYRWKFDMHLKNNPLSNDANILSLWA